MFSPHALSCSATNDDRLTRATKRNLSSFNNSIPAASANETSARSKVNRTPSLRPCSSQAPLSSSTHGPVNRPSTLSLTATLDDSTTDIFIAPRSRSANIGSLPANHKSSAEGSLHGRPRASKGLFQFQTVRLKKHQTNWLN